MESTGVFWKPVYNVLEGMGFQLLVANAQHSKAVRGGSVKHAEWIADLLRHGLLRESFIPERPQRELQELPRARTSLVRQRAQVVHRIQKVLEGANVKLSAVATDVTGVSGRAMLDAIVAGEENPEALARLAWGRLQRKQAQLVAALQGRIGAHQRCLLASLLRQLDFLEAEIDQLSTELARRLRPWEAVLERLDTIPGVGRRAAEHLVAELGPDVSRFPTAAYLASWARLCPGSHASAGKRQSGAIGHGNPWLRAILVEIAWAAARTRHTYLAAQYRRLAARRGAKRALIALAHTILITVYHPLRDDGVYQDLGENYCDERARQQVVRRTVRRLERLAYEVTVEAA